ncbi:multidrug RND transporter, partial [Pseudomonas sp. MWU12-2312b]
MSSKTLRTGFSLVLLAMTLAGCANYSGLNTEGVSLEAKNLKAGQTLSGVKLSPASWPKSDWWKSLGDPQLDGLIREALHDSPD